MKEIIEVISSYKYNFQSLQFERLPISNSYHKKVIFKENFSPELKVNVYLYLVDEEIGWQKWWRPGPLGLLAIGRILTWTTGGFLSEKSPGFFPRPRAPHDCWGALGWFEEKPFPTPSAAEHAFPGIPYTQEECLLLLRVNILVNWWYPQERQGKDPLGVSDVTLSLAKAKRDDIRGTEMAGRKTKIEH